MGPSGVGKSHVIRHLEETGEFTYLRPYTTRPLRPGETSKIQVSEDRFQFLYAMGEIMLPTTLYGNWYGPSRKELDNIASRNEIAVIDWPAQRIQALEEEVRPLTLKPIYLLPPNKEELHKRLGQDARDPADDRYRTGTAELEQVRRGVLVPTYPKIVNGKDISETVQKLLKETK